MKKPLIFGFCAWMLAGGVELAHAQRQAPSRGTIRAGRQENRANGATGRGALRGNTTGNAAGAGTGTTGTTGAGATATNGQNIQQGGGTGGDQGATSSDPVKQARISALRALMNAAGITEVPVQDQIIGFIFTQERERQPLLQMAREAIAQMNQTAGTQAGGLTAVVTDNKVPPGDGNKDVIDDDPGLAKYQEYMLAVEADIARYNADLQKLDTLIGYSRKPRIEAFLNLIGVLNNDVYGFGGPEAVFANVPNQGTAQNGTAPGQAPPVTSQQ